MTEDRSCLVQAERRTQIIQARGGARDHGGLGLQAIKDDLHALRGDGSGLQILAQMADLGGEGLEGLCVRRGGLSVGSRDNDRCKNGA